MYRSSKLKREISCLDSYDLLVLIQDCINSKTEGDVLKIFYRLNNLISFEFAIAGRAYLNDQDNIVDYEVFNISYPSEWLSLYISKDFKRDDVIVRENFRKFSLQNWQETYMRHKVSNEFRSIAEDYGLKDGVTYGMKYIASKRSGSIFSIAGRKMNYDNRTRAIIEHVFPHLHLVLFRVLQADGKRTIGKKIILSEREREILSWLKAGKSSWDISVILGISERTVNFHIYNSMEKLGAVKRAQAVSVATHYGLIDLD